MSNNNTTMLCTCLCITVQHKITPDTNSTKSPYKYLTNTNTLPDVIHYKTCNDYCSVLKSAPTNNNHTY